MIRRLLLASSVLVLPAAFAGSALAEDTIQVNEPLVATSATPIADCLRAQSFAFAADPQDARPVAIEYSESHETRAKIHKYASWAVLPLMGTEWALGQKLYDDPNSDTSSSRGIHGAVGAGLIGLFAVQSVTGVWNLFEERQAPGNTKRWAHGLLMLGAEGGFIAAAAMAPGHSRSDLINFDAQRSTHRTVALVSIGAGTAGYLLMLLTGGNK
jgi:hypothetical protein